MSATKIKYYEASDLGHRIARKAFEHLTAPHEAVVDEFVKGVYDGIIEHVIGAGNIAKFVSAGVLVQNAGSSLNFVTGTDSVACAVKGEMLVRPAGYSNPFQVDDETVSLEYFRVCEPLQALWIKQAALAQEIKEQVTNKSAKHVMKVWPEAATIVAEFFNIDIDGKDKSMTSPLDQLLSKFMPLLAAPQGV
jgi:hypothetical protein